MAPLDGMAGALSRGSRTPGIVKGNIRVTGLTPQSRNTSARSALRRLSSIASALSYYKEWFPDNVSTRGDVDAYSRASRARLLIKYYFITLAYLLIVSRGGYSLMSYWLLIKSYNCISGKEVTCLKPILRIHPYIPHK